MDGQELGFFSSFVGLFIFLFVILYHYVVAEPKYTAN